MKPALLVLAALLAWSAPARAASAKAEKKPAAAQKRSIALAEYFLKVPTARADPKFVEPFLKLDPDALPKRLRARTRAKQLDIRALIRLQQTKKKGRFLMSKSCGLSTFIHPFSDEGAYALAGYERLTEDEERYLMKRTHCTEQDLGCEFSLEIFFDKKPKDKKKRRHLRLHAKDPLWTLVGQYRSGKGSEQTQFFGAGGLTCLHEK